MKKKESKAAVSVSLPVISQNRTTGVDGRIRPKSTMGRKRAAVLIAVHLVIIVHIVQWLVMGTTLSPVEPSESMSTLELGAVNAGFVFFVLAILSTLVFGRFLCGWGCHVVALQDLCSTIMLKLGVRPKPFRSRLLVWAPLAFGLYMFVWPSFKRLVVFPAMELLDIARPVWLGAVPALHGFHSEMMVDDFWATFPPWYVAIPFFGVIGFAAVYFLGSKGFCTYGCPYGGIFGVADTVSPGRIIVSDACEGCGHCTAVCTSNVRVHEEVRDFGMVVDPGCMKCMDCVSACPNDALSFGFAAPAITAKPRNEEAALRVKRNRRSSKRFDLSVAEEVLVAAVFVGLFLAFRGFLNMVPLLMAAGMAGVGAFLIWKLWSLAIRPNVRVQSLQLKAKGRWFVSGVVFALLGILTVASALWGGRVSLDRWLAHLDHERISVPLAVVLRPEFVPSERVIARATSGVARFERSRPFAEGGQGWTLRPSDHREAAFLSLLIGEREDAEAHLGALIETGVPTDEIVQHLGSLMMARGASREAVIGAYADAVERHPELAVIRAELARLRIGGGASPESALEDWESRLASDSVRDTERFVAADLFLSLRRTDRAAEIMDSLDIERIRDSADMAAAGRVLAQLGRDDDAVAILTSAAEARGATAATAIPALTTIAQMGRLDTARDLCDRATTRYPDSVGLAALGGALDLASGEADRAAARFRAAVDLARGDAWELASVGETIVKAGLGARRTDITDIGLASIESAASLNPDSLTIRHDLGQALLACGRFDEGLEMLRSVAVDPRANRALRSSFEQAEQRVRALRGG